MLMAALEQLRRNFEDDIGGVHPNFAARYRPRTSAVLDGNL